MERRFKRELIVSVGIILSSLLVSGSALLFLNGLLDGLAAGISEDRVLTQKQSLTTAALAELKNSAAQAVAYKRIIDKLLVDQDRLLDFPRWVSELARIRRVSRSFAFAGNPNPRQGELPANIQFNLDVGGTLGDVTGFLEDLEIGATQYLVSLDSLELRGDGGQYTISTRGKVYFR